jgi:hypothetical protein
MVPDKLLISNTGTDSPGTTLPNVLSRNPVFKTSSLGYQVLQFEADINVRLEELGGGGNILFQCLKGTEPDMGLVTIAVDHYRYTCRLAPTLLGNILNDWWQTNDYVKHERLDDEVYTAG